MRQILFAVQNYNNVLATYGDLPGRVAAMLYCLAFL